MKSVLVYSQLLPCIHPATTDRPDNRDSSEIPGKNKFQTFGLNKLSLLRTLAYEDTNLRSPQCPQYEGVDCTSSDLGSTYSQN